MVKSSQGLLLLLIIGVGRYTGGRGTEVTPAILVVGLVLVMTDHLKLVSGRRSGLVLVLADHLNVCGMPVSSPVCRVRAPVSDFSDVESR